MCHYTYYRIVTEGTEKMKYELRYEIAQIAIKEGIKPTARRFNISRKTVRKWRNRYLGKGPEGLVEVSRAPQNSPLKIDDTEEKKIINLCSKYKRWGALRMKNMFGINHSSSTIYRIKKQNNLIVKRTKKWRKKRDLREYKKQRYKAFDKIQIDAKDLKDMPEYWGFMMEHKLPTYQYTCREIITGAQFKAYAYNNNSSNAEIFGAYVLEHLKTHNLLSEQTHIQTDNGSEFIGHINIKKPERAAFRCLVEKKFKLKHITIPPGRCTYNSDVETAHRLIEDEFYEIESFDSIGDFMGKSYTYQVFFNCFRKNSYKNNKTPTEVFLDQNPDYTGDINNAFTLPPVILENLAENYYKCRIGGTHVPDYPIFESFCTASDSEAIHHFVVIFSVLSVVWPSPDCTEI